MMAARSMLLNSLPICLREKWSSPSTRRDPFLTDELMRPVTSCSVGWSLKLSWTSWLLTRISVKVLRKLCATPAAIVPMASIFWACCSWFSSRLRSVMSVIIKITVDSSPLTGSFLRMTSRSLSSSGGLPPMSLRPSASGANSAATRSRTLPLKRSGGCAVSIFWGGIPSIATAAELA